MSPKFVTLGNRWAKTEAAKGLISEKPTGSQPSGSQATDAASMPEKVDRYLMACILIRGLAAAQEKSTCGLGHKCRRESRRLARMLRRELNPGERPTREAKTGVRCHDGYDLSHRELLGMNAQHRTPEKGWTQRDVWTVTGRVHLYLTRLAASMSQFVTASEMTCVTFLALRRLYGRRLRGSPLARKPNGASTALVFGS